jgi:hypothetical protein
MNATVDNLWALAGLPRMIVVFKSSMRLGVLHWMRNEIYPFQFLLFSYSLSPSLAAGATKETACVPCQAGYYFVFTGSKQQQLECVPMPAVEYLLNKRLSTLIWQTKKISIDEFKLPAGSAKKLFVQVSKWVFSLRL